MAERTLVSWATIILPKIVIRTFLLLFVFISTWYSSDFFLYILVKYLGYINPNDYFSFLLDALVSVSIGSVFLGSIVFGSLGKKFDYFLISLIFIAASIAFFYSEKSTSSMFVGLAIAALLGNTIGFGLKLLRKKYFPKFNI